MPQDAFTIKYLAKELDSILKNAKITKINQPEADEVVLTTYGKEGTKKVVLSANSNLFRCHITKEEKPNPITAPSFCMLLRKHLQGSVILSVDTPTNDRIIQFSILSKNEMQDNENVKLVIELISGLANIILVNKDDVILGSLKKNSIDDEKAKRIIMTGIKYEFPYSNKIAFSNLTKIEQLLNEFKEGNITDYLMNNVAGFAYS
ncbi:MAG: NFACT family protein, partial [Clostridia bacterium]|nr:NFACT family protein [Clostridia bacterium]